MPKLPQNTLTRLRLDERLAFFRAENARQAPPRLGWVRALRKALGMTREQFGKRAGIAKSTVADLENSEREGTIQLNSLRRAAEALDCDLVYALVPRQPIGERVNARLDELAEAAYRRAAHSMALENQLEDDAAAKAIKIAAIRDAISLRDLWREP